MRRKCGTALMNNKIQSRDCPTGSLLRVLLLQMLFAALAADSLLDEVSYHLCPILVQRQPFLGLS